MKLLRVTIRVRNQLEALKFYTEQLGFEKRTDFPYGQAQRWITVSPPDEQNVQIVLQPPDWFNGEERVEHLKHVGHNPALVFQIEDCHATYEELKSRGVLFIQPQVERPYGIEADAVDLDGNTLVFLQLTNTMSG